MSIDKISKKYYRININTSSYNITGDDYERRKRGARNGSIIKTSWFIF